MTLPTQFHCTCLDDFTFNEMMNNKFKQVGNSDFLNKPDRMSSFWTSTYHKEYVSSWVEWTVADDYLSEEERDTHVFNGYFIEPDKDANIFYVNGLEDMKYLWDKYPRDIPTYGNSYSKYIDFSLLSKDYDALSFTDKALSTLYDLPYQDLIGYGYNSYDAESTVWFRKKFTIKDNVKLQYKETELV